MYDEDYESPFAVAVSLERLERDEEHKPERSDEVIVEYEGLCHECAEHGKVADQLDEFDAEDPFAFELDTFHRYVSEDSYTDEAYDHYELAEDDLLDEFDQPLIEQEQGGRCDPSPWIPAGFHVS